MEDKSQSVTKLKLDSQGNQTATVGRFQITILKPLCIGATSCVAIAPNIFQMNEQNIAQFIQSGSENPTTLLLAAQACPTRAITITDNITGEQIWPKKSPAD